MITFSNTIFTLAENRPIGTTVGTVSAISSNAGDKLSYAITAGNSDPSRNGIPVFVIDPNTGVISVNDSSDLDFETTPQFKLQVTATDPAGLSNTAEVTVNLSNFTAAPILDNVATSANYTENALATTLAPNVSVSAPESTTLGSAIVTISAGFVMGDELSANVAGTNITASYDANLHTLLLSGIDSVAHYQQALASVTFSSTSDNPTNYGAAPTRTLDWQVFHSITPASGLFTTLSNYPVGSFPKWVGISDINNDGKADLLISNKSTGTVSVLLGNGDGTFQNKPDLAVGGDPLRAVIADLNNDGKPDLAVPNSSSNTLSVLLGNGDGTFQTKHDFAVERAPVSVAAADFNADGKLDLVVPNRFSSNVAILLGNGDGTFVPAKYFLTTPNATSVAVGDVNKDGKLDLVLPSLFSRAISVLLGNGDGTFSQKTDINADPGLTDIALVDINKDGMLDIVTPSTFFYHFNVLLGKGDGSFLPKQDIEVDAYGLAAIAVADINNDGNLDLAASSETRENIYILLGNGNGTFQIPLNLDVKPTTFSHPFITSGDLNNDGWPELVTLSSDQATVLLNTGNNASLAQHTTLNITALNGAPNVANAIADQTAIQINKAFSYTVNANTFIDPDSILAYSATLDNGNPLPAWLSFDASTRTFTGTPQASDIANLTLKVLASDGSNPTASDSFTLPVVELLIDARLPSQDFKLTENSPNGTALVTVTDVAYKIGDTRSYAFTTGNSDPNANGSRAFAIDVTTGAITVNDSADLDYEATPRYNLEITANDPAGLVNTGSVAITLGNVPEPGNDRPEIQDAAFLIPERSLVGSTVGTVVASDADAGDILSYTITAGNSDPNGNSIAAFAINPATGTITVNDTGDLSYLKTQAITRLQATVTDGGGLTAWGNLTVTVTNVNDAPSGADKTVIMAKNTSYSFKAADFGFSDLGDTPANNLLAVKINAVPLQGTLTNNGMAVVAGQFIAIADINNGGLKFAPTANAAGTGYANFGFQVQDDDGTANGGQDLDPTANILTMNVTAGGVSYGDPHLITFDGLHYEFQTTGDYVLVHALDSGLEVQVRQAHPVVNPASTVNTDLATVIDGNHLLFGLNERQPVVNGEIFAVAIGETRALGQGSVAHSSVASAGDFYTVNYANGDILTVQYTPDYIDPSVYLIGSQKVVGLLGNNNGLADDDIALRDGTVAANPLAVENLYGNFATSWLVTAEESLFTPANNISLSAINANPTLTVAALDNGIFAVETNNPEALNLEQPIANTDVGIGVDFSIRLLGNSGLGTDALGMQ